MTPHEAMVIVARQILANATIDVEWEDFPDIGQYDFDRIVSYAKLMAPDPPQFNEALTLLERRAQVEDNELAWTIICNAYGGDWSQAPDEWREAAIAWGERNGFREADDE